MIAKRKRSRIAFDHEGRDYDYESAKAAGNKPDKTGHWPSRDERSGRILKGRKHKTYYKTVIGEDKAGYDIYKGEEKRYYSKKRKRKRKQTKKSPSRKSLGLSKEGYTLFGKKFPDKRKK